MPPSQLKRLKASLREQGIVGPQKSKKQKQKGLSTEQKIKRNVALESIREDFNPFEVKHLSRPAKREHTTPATMNGKTQKGTLGRPGVSKSLGEQKRRETLLMEVQSRSKVGGILDRRIGEDDPTMTAEDKAIKRYAWEKQRKSKKKGTSVFDLEGDDDDGEDLLTHGGQALDLKEDYDAASVEGDSDNDSVLQKRRRHSDDEGSANEDAAEDEPDRKKTKREVMEEVITKSKLHKYERQQAKEDDDDMRLALDKDLSDVQAALSAFSQAVAKPKAVPKVEYVQVEPALHPDRAALLEKHAPGSIDKSYDDQLKKIAQDGRARVTDRTRTEEEIAEAAAERKKELEIERLKRMKGESDDEDDKEEEKQNAMFDADDVYAAEEFDDAAGFGFKAFSSKSKIIHTRPEGIDDEDDFLIEEDLIASGSEVDDESEAASDHSEPESEADDLMAELTGANTTTKKAKTCPRTLEEVRHAFGDLPYSDYHETIRQIRVRVDPALAASNKEKLADFSAALVGFLAELPLKQPRPPASTIDAVIRHIHSMARKSTEPISNAFREHLRQMHSTKSMDTSDLVMLSAIGSIFPPSDHFHQIVTPALILMARWLAMTRPSTRIDLARGAFLGALCLKYQTLAKRYIPELVRFTLAALSSASKFPRKLLDPHINNLLAMANMWEGKSSFIEIFTPSLSLLESLKAKSAHLRLTILLSSAQLSRRPLLLHNHRPLPIKTAVPKFEEGFDPDKHYDPDPIRAESTRLRKEYKKEKKGAMRELRKDGNFLAREKLREKKEKDKAYEEKYRKLVASIQGEEGKEAKEYERIKKARKGR